ncbi:MAG: hypothetical protein KBD14_01845 [Candidatus Pacebacteria bacterium]|nr:hypothetical protein [Candidatus Paceibacterota bacterium]
MEKKSFTNLFHKYYIISILVVLIIGITATYLTYKQTAKETKEKLLTNVSIIANTLNSEEIKSLTGTTADISNSNYQSIKSKFERIIKLNDDHRFIYLWTYKNEKVVFLIDSENPISTEYSPPGQIYEEATELDKEVLLGLSPRSIEFSQDRWGNWLTALVPILDQNGKVVAVLGIDMNSKVYWNTIYVSLAIPIISTIFILLIIIIGFILRKKENEYIALKEKLLSVARHELRAPLTGLSWLTETMLNNKIKPEEKNQNLETVHNKIKELIENVNKVIEEK